MKSLHRIAAASLAMVALAAVGQSPLKPGLWEMTTTQRYLQGPDNLTLPTVRTYTANVCVTRDQLLRNGTLLPPRPANCELSSMSRNGNITVRSMVCKGDPFGTLTVKATAVNENNAMAEQHFMSTAGPGMNPVAIEYTVRHEFHWQRTGCGDVKPTPE
jgi:hypothetical protein